MSATHSGHMTNRRDFLRVSAATAVALGAVGTIPLASAQVDESTRFADWFDGVENYDGVVDLTGQATAAVDVGAAGNGGGFAFGPAAIRVDPWTTVVWTWTGEGGAHNVADEAGAFESDLSDESGFTFEHTFDAEGVSYYACSPHKVMGMRGAVVVGNVLVGESTTDYPEPHYGDWFDDVDNFAGTVDATGVDEVRVQVGAAGNGGNLAFEPAAVRVDPGTTVVWDWTGQGGEHNVAAIDGSYESPHAAEKGTTFAMEFDGDGISRYACPGHLADGMKGAVVVGAGGRSETVPTARGWVVGGGLGALGGGGFLYALYLHFEDLAEQTRRARQVR